MNLSEVVKLDLENKRITQTDLSKRLGTSRQHVSNSLKRWSDGDIPNIKTLKKWSKAIGVDYKKFLPYL